MSTYSVRYKVQCIIIIIHVVPVYTCALCSWLHVYVKFGWLPMCLCWVVVCVCVSLHLSFIVYVCAAVDLYQHFMPFISL